MKIWITRSSTGSLHAGGLERCRVWFVKPVYLYADTRSVWEIDNESPFGFNPKCGMKFGWTADTRDLESRGREHIDLSFGKLFGYGEPSYRPVPGLPDFVWDKLHEHYGNTPFPHGWYEYEKAHPDICNIQSFLLEIDLKMEMS